MTESLTVYLEHLFKNSNLLKTSIEVELIAKGRLKKVYKILGIGDVFSEKREREHAMLLFEPDDSLSTQIAIGLYGIFKMSVHRYLRKCSEKERAPSSIKKMAYVRNALSLLTEAEFGYKAIPEAYYTLYAKERDSYGMIVRLMKGRPVIPPKDFSYRGDWEIDELSRFQRKLKEMLLNYGFYGAVWQCDPFVSVTPQNFLKDENNRWVWIDVESLFLPLLSPSCLLKSIEIGKIIFDYVDTKKLREKVSDRKLFLKAKLGEVKYRELIRCIGLIEKYQKIEEEEEGLSKIAREFQLAHWRRIGIIGEEDGYFQGMLKALFNYTSHTYKLLTEKAKNGVKNFYSGVLDFLKVLKNSDYAKNLVFKKLSEEGEKWISLKRIDKSNLDKTLEMSKAFAEYLRDFGYHFTFKLLDPPIIGNFILLSLFLLNPMLGIAYLLHQPVLRTLYTLSRIKKSKLSRRIALVVGTVPFIGILAYPAQIAAYDVKNKGRILEFLASMYLSKVPFVGGKNSRLEYAGLKLIRKISNKIIDIDNYKM